MAEENRDSVANESSSGTAGGSDDRSRRVAVRRRYGDQAQGSDGDCCTGSTRAQAVERLGYDAADAEVSPEAAALSLGCGNPTAIDGLSPGEAVIDLGSGGGFDCFLAAREVGPDGRVVGVDMTPEMVETARANAADAPFKNVEFRLGEIGHLPAADVSFDVVISNCVVNLSPDKNGVFEETYRVLRPGGRVAVSDVVKTAALPSAVAADVDALSACIAGAERIDILEDLLTEAGFTDVAITPQDASEEFIREWDDGYDLSEYVVSAAITARKPM
jgi:SAM-dependent methyltransferase